MKAGMLAVIFALALYSVQGQRIAPDTIAFGKGTLIVQPIQHASLVLRIGDKTIYVDPVGGAGKYAELPMADYILITDIHGDHFDTSTLNGVKSAGALIVPQAVADLLPASLKTPGLIVLGNGDHKKVDGITITAIPMYNLPAGNPNAMHPKGRGNGYVLEINDKKIYLSGDTEDIPEMRALKNIDVAFVCMNLPYTMDVNHAADAVLAFKPKIVYPYHYRGKDGLSDVNAFKKLVQTGNKDIEVRLRNWYPG